MHVQETTEDLVSNVPHVVDFKELVACYYFVHVRFDEIHDNVPRWQRETTSYSVLSSLKEEATKTSFRFTMKGFRK